MKSVPSGGLRGKARNVHHRDRADRGFAEQLLEEYLEPEPLLSGSGAFAPIRGRSEFLPSAFEMEEDSDMRTGMQLEFPLVEETDEEVGPGRRVVWSTKEKEGADYGMLRIVVDDPELAEPSEPLGERDQAAPRPRVMEARQNADEPKVLRLPRRARANMPLGWSHETHARKNSHLTVRGFVTGCLIGGAAAAVALTVLNIAMR